MAKYDIKITGDGTAQEIVEGLKKVIATIEETTRTYRDDIGTVEWEDETLITEITEKD